MFGRGFVFFHIRNCRAEKNCIIMGQGQEPKQLVPFYSHLTEVNNKMLLYFW